MIQVSQVQSQKQNKRFPPALKFVQFNQNEN